MHIDDLIEKKALSEPGYAIAYAILQLARQTERIADALEPSPDETPNCLEKMAMGLYEVAEALRPLNGR